MQFLSGKEVHRDSQLSVTKTKDLTTVLRKTNDRKAERKETHSNRFKNASSRSSLAYTLHVALALCELAVYIIVVDVSSAYALPQKMHHKQQQQVVTQTRCCMNDSPVKDLYYYSLLPTNIFIFFIVTCISVIVSSSLVALPLPVRSLAHFFFLSHALSSSSTPQLSYPNVYDGNSRKGRTLFIIVSWS